jgi:hypothetical protein
MLGSLMRIDANGNSLNTYTTLKMRIVAITGRMSGSTTDVHSRQRPAPSMIAASSISPGNSRRNPVRSSVLKGMETATYGRMSAAYVPKMPRARSRRYTGKSRMYTGTASPASR